MLEANTFINYMKTLYNVVLSNLTPCAVEIVPGYQRELRSNRSTSDRTFCIRHIVEELFCVPHHILYW